jgi:hypothetical protein
VRLPTIAMKLLSQKQALNTLLALILLVVVFHLLVLVQVIPYNIVWAGSVKSVAEMQVMESISIFINILLITTLLLKGNYFEHSIPEAVLRVILWIFVVVFILNTFGNLFSETTFERYVFSLLTLISALLCLRIVWNPKKNITT